MEKIFYNASLPRSGSTLLQNLLAQNPDIYASPTSGLIELINNAKVAFTDRPEFAALDSQLVKKGFANFCKGGIEGYCSAITDKQYVIDKNFSWGKEFNLLTTMNGAKPKIIVMVRDLRDVFASMEEGYRTSPEKANPNVDWTSLRNTTLEKRLNSWASGQPVGSSLDILMELIVQKNDKDIFFVKYEHLCQHAAQVMEGIYKYLEIPHYNHNFNKIEQLTDQNDNMYVYNHKIRPTLEVVPSKAETILGKEGCKWVSDNYQWFFKYFQYAL
jgi:sulfotransferase